MKCNIDKRFILFVHLIFLFNFIFSANAATLTWTGGGTDNLASNADNWSSGIVPQNGDTVIFNANSIDAIWNLSMTLASLTKTSGYTGKITKVTGTTLTIARVKRWTGGGNNELASNPDNWSGNTLPQSGDKIVFDETATKDCTWDMSVTPAFLSLTGYTGMISLDPGISNLTVSGDLTIASGMLNLNDKALNVDGYILLTDVGTLNATSSTITVKGNWSNNAFFNYGTSTVVLAGTNQAIYGSTTFYNLQKIVTAADTLYFGAGSTQTILNNLALQGAANNLLSLRSTVDGQPWYINPKGTRTISFADVKDSYNEGPVAIILDSVDSGNNANLHFGEDCVCLPSGIFSRESKMKLRPGWIDET